MHAQAFAHGCVGAHRLGPSPSADAAQSRGSCTCSASSQEMTHSFRCSLTDGKSSHCTNRMMTCTQRQACRVPHHVGIQTLLTLTHFPDNSRTCRSRPCKRSVLIGPRHQHHTRLSQERTRREINPAHHQRRAHSARLQTFFIRVQGSPIRKAPNPSCNTLKSGQVDWQEWACD